MKLSEIWNLAAKELTQVKGNFGSRSTKKACASGAVAYYVNTENPSDWLMPRGEAITLCGEWEEKLPHPISYYNDELGWTFQQFADKARELGI